MIKKILSVKDPRIRQKSAPIKTIDKKIKSLAQELLITLKAQKDPKGVGLAAPQIGKNLRVFAMLWKKKERIFINPEIIWINKISPVGNQEEQSILEGCLSIPYYYGALKRPQKLKLKYQNLQGQIKTKIFEGFSAQIIQHEIDHLNGTLFTDRLIKQKSPFYKIRGEEWEKIQLS